MFIGIDPRAFDSRMEPIADFPLMRSASLEVTSVSRS